MTKYKMVCPEVKEPPKEAEVEVEVWLAQSKISPEVFRVWAQNNKGEKSVLLSFDLSKGRIHNFDNVEVEGVSAPEEGKRLRVSRRR